MNPTLALDCVEGKRVAVTIPTGAVVKVVGGDDNADRLVDVAWEGRVVAMFALDVKVRGVEIKDQDTDTTDRNLGAASA